MRERERERKGDLDGSLQEYGLIRIDEKER
jgi:hypothetical protein